MDDEEMGDAVGFVLLIVLRPPCSPRPHDAARQGNISSGDFAGRVGFVLTILQHLASHSLMRGATARGARTFHTLGGAAPEVAQTRSAPGGIPLGDLWNEGLDVDFCLAGVARKVVHRRSAQRLRIRRDAWLVAG